MLANILVILVLGILLAIAVRKIINDKKAGIGSCGHKCSECSLSGLERSCNKPSSDFLEFKKKRALEKMNKPKATNNK